MTDYEPDVEETEHDLENTTLDHDVEEPDPWEVGGTFVPRGHDEDYI